jgi:ribosomal protein S7
MKNRSNIKNKIINLIMLNGEKKTSEKVLISSFKELQKNSKKQSKKLIQLAIIFSTPIFKLHKISNKKQKKRNKKIREIPAFMSKPMSRISKAIKLILSSAITNKDYMFYKKLKQEILLASQSKGIAIELKNNIQKQVLLKKYLFKYYRWK